MSKILITGGTGLIGQRLSELLCEKGHEISHLSRSKNPKSKYKTYLWKISEKYIDPAALDNLDHVIHLAGHGVAEGRWTKTKKQSILSSRVKSANLIFDNLKNSKLKTYISASGISFYGATTTNDIYTEDANPETDFLAQVTVQWEQSAMQFKSLADRVVCVRTPVVLSSKGGALSKMAKPIKMGFGSPLGKGNQYMPWIHIDDLCEVYIKAIEDSKMEGIFNASSAEHITNSQLTIAIAKQLNKNIWAPKVPGFVLKLVLGKMSGILLNGSRISNQKLLDIGFKFKFGSLSDALKDCLK